MILSLYYCILLITLLCRKIAIAENDALFGVKSVSLKFGWCKENYIFQVWARARERKWKSRQFIGLGWPGLGGP